MGFFLTDLAKSAFTPPGTNARSGQQGRQSQAAGYGLDLMNGESAYQGEAQRFRENQWDHASGAVDQLGKFTTQAGRDDWTRWYTNQQQAGARSAAANAPAMFGGNEALGESYALDAMNRANQRSGEFQARINSPEGIQQALQSYLQGLGAVAPNYDGLARLAGIVYGQPEIHVGQGLGDFFGSLAGRVTGGGGNGSGNGNGGGGNAFSYMYGG